MRPASAVLCLSIIASTVLLKQHSCIDVVMGILLAMAVDSAASSLERSESRILQNP
jgi:membrane-associated phospholipid phosphatase